MLPLETIRQARRHLRRNLLFPRDIESTFREEQHSRYRYPRAIFYTLIAFAFGLAPLYNETLFRPDPSIHTLLLVIQIAWTLPATMMVIAVSLWSVPRHIACPVHVYGVVSFWGSVLSMNLLDLLGLMDYPTALVPAAILSIGLFGGYPARSFMMAASLAFVIYLVTTAAFESEQVYVLHRLYETVFFWFFALTGPLTNDQLARRLWLRSQETEVLSRIDALTGIANRSSFNDSFKRIAANAAREGKFVGIALLDLDHFKSVNDRFGHEAGDEVLRRAAEAIAGQTARRALDIVARYGGEEFVIAWHDPKPQDFPDMLEGLLGRVREIKYRCPISGDTHRLTASIGAYYKIPEPHEDMRTMLSEADRRLYQAKAEGRDRAVICGSAAPSKPH